MINDVTALADPASRRVIAESGVPVILMHMKGDPRTMQKNPVYDDVVADVCADLACARDAAVAEGVPPDRIWLDPGLGFGKTLEHNLALLDATPRLKALGHPVLVGASRKSFIGRIDRDGPADQRIGGSVAAALSAAARGADGVRVHDLAETRQALAVWSAIEGAPAG
jgi:dihydropteroate synthase